MGFEYLDKESEDILCHLLKKDSVSNYNARGSAVENLINQGYIKGIDCKTLEDVEPNFVLTEITQKGKSYFEFKSEYEKENKRLSQREWKIAIISAIIGALIGLIPYAVQIIA